MTSEGAMPVYNVGQQGQDGMFGASGGGMMFVLFLLILFAAFSGGGGLFGNRAAAAETAAVAATAGYATRAEMQAEIQNGFNQARLEGDVRALEQAVVSGFQATAAGLSHLGASTQTSFAQMQHNLDLSTCSITSAIREDGNLTRAQMAAQREQELRDQLWQSQLNAQSAQLVNAIVPRPMPAYNACSPYGFNAAFGAPYPMPVTPMPGACAPCGF